MRTNITEPFLDTDSKEKCSKSDSLLIMSGMNTHLIYRVDCLYVEVRNDCTFVQICFSFAPVRALRRKKLKGGYKSRLL
jgi:hypothetical protein